MLIGLDLDNTIIDYDPACARVGRRLGLLPAGFTGGKREVRNDLWSQPDGDVHWQVLQAELYGAAIHHAGMTAGAAAFITQCQAAGFALVIISHKTEFAAAAPQGANLRASALAWLQAHGLADIPVHFTNTRDEKLRRIAALNCRYFVDDLAALLLDPAFPATTTGLYYLPRGEPEHSTGQQLRICRSWRDVAAEIFAAAETSRA